MEKMVYKFLDAYCGTGEFSSSMINKGYHLYSSNKKLVLRFRPTVENSELRFILFKSHRLCKTVAQFFGIDEDDATTHIKLWLGKRAGLNIVNDLRKYL